jgi:hypothetical protein
MAAFNWQEFLQTLGGQAILLAAVGYLIKTLVSSRLEKDAEAFKADLKRNSDMEIERLKNALQMTALEHQVRFSKLHERRAEIIGKLSRLIQEVPIVVSNLVDEAGKSMTASVDAKSLEKAKDFTFEVSTCVQANHVIFPEDLCKRLEEYARRLYRMPLLLFGLNSEDKTYQNRVLTQMNNELYDEIPALQKKLIEDLRELLAGSSD